MTRFSQHAPAKLNLYLHVTGKRVDGFHTLESLVAFADIGDRITVSAHTGLKLSITGPYADQVPNGPDNLVLKAARALADDYSVGANAHIELEKNLPVASGIGGGSADAAATLRALVSLWRLKISDQSIREAAYKLGDTRDDRHALDTLFSAWRGDIDCERMSNLALSLGADVPVCLEGRTVYMGSIGEHLTLAPPLPKVWVVLANPHTKVSTPAVFKARTGDFSPPNPLPHAPQDAQDLAQMLSKRKNDLFAPAQALSPEIQDVIKVLNQQSGCLLARMSGSGATCFALFANPDLATTAQLTLNQSHPQWWAKAAQLLHSPPMEKWL